MSKVQLELKASHNLVLTPQLQQAIKLLQMSSLELSEFLNKELLSNPMLEETSQTNDTPNSEEINHNPADNKEQNIQDPNIIDNQTIVDSVTEEASLDVPEHAFDDSSVNDNINREDSFEHLHDYNLSFSSTGSSKPYDHEDQENLIELISNKTESLRSLLIGRFRLLTSNNLEIIIAEQLIDLLDDSGWFTKDIHETAQKLGCPKEQIEKIIAMLQTCEPYGIFASSLKDCLLIQLKNLNLMDETFKIILDNLQLVADNNVKKLEKKTKKTLSELKQYMSTIRSLNPKPATEFEDNIADIIIPDILVYKDSRNKWQVTINEQNTPNISVRQKFYNSIKKKINSKEEKNFISKNYQNASWLVKSLHQRNRTMQQVAEHIVQHQQLFFDRGISSIRPMILKEIAERTSLHESTISRITTNKFMATPWGTFEMKYFFNVSLNSLNGQENHAATSVKHSIKQMIHKESPQNILSDDKIVKSLREQGINIARRTVTKYREALNIPSSIIRRQQKNQKI